MKATRSILLSEEQTRKLQETLKGHHLEAIIRLALVTGMRRDELLSLKWQDVDLSTGEIRFQNTKTKNMESLHITDDVVALLKQHETSQKETQLTAGQSLANLDLVFSDQTGERLRPHQLVKSLHEILAQAGLPRISFHDLRGAAKKKERLSGKVRGISPLN